MSETTIPVAIPDGFEFVRYGLLRNGERHLNEDGTVSEPSGWAVSQYPCIIVREIKWRQATKLDMLRRDELECRVRMSSTDRWVSTKLLAVVTNGKRPAYLTTCGYTLWNEAEVRVDMVCDGDNSITDANRFFYGVFKHGK